MTDKKVFTEHIQSLLAGKAHGSLEFVAHLRKVVIHRLRKMGQWSLPPSYLGYEGETWEHSSVLDDLMQDAYVVCVLRPLKKGRYAEILQASDTVEGYVHWKLKWFLKDRQRKGNPIGSRIFHNIETASRLLVESRQAISSADSKFTHATIILAIGKSSPTSGDQLTAYFVNELVKLDFAKTFCKCTPKSQRQIEEHVAAQFQGGLTGFVIGELTNICTAIITQTLRTANYDPSSCIEYFETEDFWIASRMILDEDRYSNLDELRNDLRRYAKTIRKNISNRRIRKRLIRILRFLAVRIVRGEDVRNLSQAQIALELGVSKSTLNEDVARLRNAITELMQDASEKDTQQ